MSAYAGQPPAETPVVLAIAMLIMRRYELALIEADAITVPNDAPPYDQALLIAIRTFALRSNGYPKMAARQAQAVPEGSESGKALNDPQVQAVLCLLRAYMAAQDRDYRQADLELVQAMRIYPNSPIVVYLTGEVQVGEGQFEKAQVSLDGLVQGLPPDTDPWLLEHLRDRARYLRDKKGEPEPLIADPQFVARLALHCLWQSAKTSEPIRKIQEKVESAREFGAQFLKVLPGGGGAAEE